MEKYKSADLLRKKILAVEDLLVIGRIVYRVEKNGGKLYLSNQESCASNEKIFFILDIPDKIEFCRSHYGYEPSPDSDFPYTKPNDFKALTRAALTLMQESERQGYSEIPNTYRSTAALSAEKLLYRDVIQLGEYGYTVDAVSGGYFFLFSTEHSNDEIFTHLRLNPITFCQEHYGYEPHGGTFPQTKPGDLAALKRVIMALFKELEKLENK